MTPTLEDNLLKVCQQILHHSTHGAPAVQFTFQSPTEAARFRFDFYNWRKRAANVPQEAAGVTLMLRGNAVVAKYSPQGKYSNLTGEVVDPIGAEVADIARRFKIAEPAPNTEQAVRPLDDEDYLAKIGWGDKKEQQ